MAVFNEQQYLLQNPDVAAAVARGEFPSGYAHYLRYGKNEGRIPFDEAGYLQANPDVAAAVARGEFSSGLQHYQQYGQAEGRNNWVTENPTFNEQQYLAANPDVAAAVQSGQMPSGIAHYQQYGINENRSLGIPATTQQTTTQNITTNPALSGIINPIIENLKPSTPFSKVYSYEDFWNPQRDYITGLAASQYRPEFERYQLNPYEQATQQGTEQLRFNQGLSGTWRTGQAPRQFNQFQNERTLGKEQLEQQYGNTIQNVINQYQQNVANPLYQDWWRQWDESPTQNIDVFKATNKVPNTLIDQYKPIWEA